MAKFQINEAHLFTAEAGADLTGAVMKCVKINSDGTAVLAGADEKAAGVVYEESLSTSTPYGPVTIQYAGIAKCIASGSISAGARVACAASGAVKSGTTNPIGIALNTVTGANQIVSVLLVN